MVFIISFTSVVNVCATFAIGPAAVNGLILTIFVSSGRDGIGPSLIVFVHPLVVTANGVVLFSGTIANCDVRGSSGGR